MNIGDVGGDETLSQTSQLELHGAPGSNNDAGGGGGGAAEVCNASRTPEATERLFTDKAVDMLNDLREKEQLCDGVVRTGETSFLIHRNVLSASSAFFRAVFTTGGGVGGPRAGGGRGEPLQEVMVEDVPRDILNLVVNYAYGCTVFLNEDNVLDVFHAADRLMMPSLAKECCRFLKKQLCSENCLGIAAFARAFFRSGLERAAMRYAYGNFSSLVSDSQEFLELPADSLLEFLSSDEVNVRHEELVFEAICKWIQHEPESRKLDMPRMLRAVRLGFLSTEYLMERIKAHEYVSTSEEAKQVVVEALKYVCKLETKEVSRVHSSSPMSKPRVPYEILFVIGGWSGGSPTNIVETYDTRSDQWLVCRAPDCEPRAYHACVTIGHVIFIVGGFNGVEYFNCCRKFYPKTMRWMEGPPMNSKRCYVSAVALKDKVYALGGFDGHVRLNTVERLDPATNQWSHVMPMAQQRSDAKASVLNDKIYICGGFNGQECLNTAEYFDPGTNQWTMISPMRNRRSGLGVVAYHGCLYAMGGFNGITRMNTAERFEPRAQVWTPLPEMYSPRSNFAVGVVDELLFVIGGFNGVTTISHVECFDDVTNEWFDAAGLSLFRSALCACVVKDLPNVQDFIFKPKPSPSKRKRSHNSDHKHQSSPEASSSTTAPPDGPQAPPPPPAPPEVLNQLA